MKTQSENRDVTENAVGGATSQSRTARETPRPVRSIQGATAAEARYVSLLEASSMAHAATENATREAEAATQRRIQSVDQFRSMMSEVMETLTGRGNGSKSVHDMRYAMVHSSDRANRSRDEERRLQNARVFLAASFRVVLALIGLFLTMY